FIIPQQSLAPPAIIP
uniref:Zein Zp22/6 protein n=1 Tax=Zea mays TaxID=4577 RepID=Q7M1F8_MAIZE